MKKMHVSLFVSSLSKSLEFYNSLFGTNPSKVKNEYAKYELEDPGLIISFIEKPGVIQNQFGHLGFRVNTQDELMIRLLEAKQSGLSIKEEIGTSCCYAKQDKFWVSDPDGYQWEVYYFHEDVEFNDPHEVQSNGKEETACCAPPS
ncbi:MAG: glyoxalase/bleomycin resistance/dioxygenase family protein [Chitinophagales bacterium]|nr:glyoxalase/bleomycin resistance/dioxygenase family protein [Chitinophagales bacterium]